MSTNDGRARLPLVILLPNHPSQIWMLRPVAVELERQAVARVQWILRDKDVALELADNLGIQYRVLSRARTGLLGNAWEFIANVPRAVGLSREYGAAAWVTKYGCGSIAAFLTGRHAIAFNDDDADVIPLIAWTSYPFSCRVLVPAATRMGRFEPKARRYRGNHELFYLHPSRYSPDPSVRTLMGVEAGERYALVRLSALQAHHDRGVRGIEPQLLRRVIRCAERRGIRLLITSEKPIEGELQAYGLSLPAHRIHDALAFADFLVSDSQTMTAEAAVLGTPAFRISDFAGRLSYIDELEKYGLARGYHPGSGEQLLADLEELGRSGNARAALDQCRELFLLDHPDPVPWFVENIKEVLRSEARAAI